MYLDISIDMYLFTYAIWFNISFCMSDFMYLNWDESTFNEYWNHWELKTKGFMESFQYRKELTKINSVNY